jgi:hypothetical protein
MAVVLGDEVVPEAQPASGNGDDSQGNFSNKFPGNFFADFLEAVRTFA